MELKKWNLHVPWFLLLLSSTHSDVGKKTSFQNHFGSPLQNQFNTKNNTRVIAQKGGLAILPCVVKINSPATVSWIRRKDFQLLTLGLSTHSSDKRFLVEHTRHMGHWSLRIKAVREEDRGFYECQLSIYPTQSIFIELKIVEAAAEISSAPELHIDEASTLRLECKLKRATENPSFVFWYHDNKMVNYDTQGGFVVTSLSTDAQLTHESGSILAVAQNIRSNKSRATFSNSSTISSSSTFNPPVTSVPQSSYLLIPSMSVLTIRHVNFQHAGNYTCAPSNARPASITVHVLRGERPAAMHHANRTVLDSENTNNNSLGINMGGYSCSIRYKLSLSFLFLPVIYLLANSTHIFFHVFFHISILMTFYILGLFATFS